jgi:hypothetical protein
MVWLTHGPEKVARGSNDSTILVGGHSHHGYKGYSESDCVPTNAIEPLTRLETTPNTDRADF